jgi:hypothetical protein
MKNLKKYIFVNEGLEFKTDSVGEFFQHLKSEVGFWVAVKTCIKLNVKRAK